MAETIGVNDLNAGQKRTLQSLRGPVIAAAKQFAGLREKLSTLAPRIVALFTNIQAEHPTFTFVDFCRMFDATVPTHAADRNGEPGYRNHRVYYTLAYMRRLVQTTGRRRGQQGVRDSATDALARTLATVLQVVSEPEQVWSAIQTEFQFSERLMTRLRKRVEQTEPLFKLAAPKPLNVGKVIHMERPEPAQGEPMEQTGRRVELEAEPATAKRKRAA